MHTGFLQSGSVKGRERIVTTMEKFITPQAPSSRRRKITKFALAGVAVVGVGAALTSAAWSDNVWFRADASAADFELQGQDQFGGWFDADESGLAIQLPASAFDEIGPGVGESYTVTVRNNGDLPIYLQPPAAVTSGNMFTAALPAQVTFGSYSDLLLDNQGDTATLEVTVTGDAGWTDAYQGITGTVLVQIQGSSAP
jgi:hypothetical protein